MIKQNEPKKIMRSQINLANYNPRKITASAKKKLSDNLEKVGLMGGIVWNEVTGNLVSGHQRIGILDKKQKYNHDTKENDYEIWVTVVRLDDKQEKEQNIFFNNANAQGFFDNDKLKELMKNIDFSEGSGFGKKEQISLLGVSELSEEEYKKIALQVEKQTSEIKQMSKSLATEVDSFYIVLVFKNSGEKEALIDNLGIELDDGRFCNGNVFIEQLLEAHADME